MKVTHKSPTSYVVEACDAYEMDSDKDDNDNIASRSKHMRSLT